MIIECRSRVLLIAVITAGAVGYGVVSSPSAGAVDASDCAPGEFYDGASCVPCPEGSYQPDAGQAHPIDRDQHAGAVPARRPVHDIAALGVDAERERGRPVGDQVDPKQLGGEQRGTPSIPILDDLKEVMPLILVEPFRAPVI